MAYSFNSDGSHMSAPGANPVAPSAADLARLRAALSTAGFTSNAAKGYLSYIDVDQVRIGGRLGDRATAEASLQAILAQYELMKTGSESQEAGGLAVDTSRLDTWLEQSSAQFRNAIEAIDAEILALQAHQRTMFDYAIRFVPSFA